MVSKASATNYDIKTRHWGLMLIKALGVQRGTAPFRRTWGLKLPLFGNLHGFRVPGNDVLALDEVQTVLYTHMVITRFLYQSAGLNERQSLPKKAKVAAI